MDAILLRLFNQIYIHPLLDGLMIGVTTVGLGLLPVLGALLFVRREQRRVGSAILAALGIGFLLTMIFWGLGRRPRPEEVRLLLSSPPFPGYPSGHTVAAFGCALVVGLSYRRLGWWLLSLGGAALISFSRIYLGAHYPSDVAAGALLGGTIGAACYGVIVTQQSSYMRWRWLLWPQIALMLLGSQMAYLEILPWHLLDWPLADKVLHFLLFGSIVFWLSMWLGPRRASWKGYSIPLAILIPFTFALLEESLQYLSPVRTLSITDLLSNWAGMLFFWWLSQTLFGTQKS